MERPHRELYASYVWRRAARVYKDANPLCVACLEGGVATPVWAVDHIVPHDGNLDLFWDESNWQSLCESHHNAKTAREQKDKQRQ